jgi:hypothetical protein
MISNSQRAFRAIKEQYIQGLEEKVSQLEKQNGIIVAKNQALEGELQKYDTAMRILHSTLSE